ncbi:hypothetical protein Q8A73_015106 [Channa argus]|nr:hypothetical protein Q8A73_015106 [Channa argus]
MYARKPTRVSDGCNDRRDSQSYQTHKSQPKSQSSTLHRYDKARDGSSDPTPPYKMLRRSDESPVSRHGESAGHGKPKTSHTVRGKNGTSGSPQENSHNNSSHHGSDSHATQSKPADRDPADDWTEHISSSGKKYYYNCRTEVSQWEKPKDLLEREQRQKDSVKMAANSFPRDMDYRQEALQDGQSYNKDHIRGPMNNGSMDMAKLNEVLAAAVTQASLRSVLHKLLTAGPAFNVTALLSAAQHSNQAQHSSQSPVSLTSDASSPRPYVSPRNGTPQSNQKSLLTVHPSSITSSQTRGSISAAKQGPAPLPQGAEKRPEDPRTHQQRSQETMCTGSNVPGAALPHGSSGSTSQSQAETPSCFTPTLATHFDESLIRHIQGWPSENTEKQAARLREDLHNMGSLYMSEICTEMKNLRSLVRVCEIQATLREQRILFLRQQSKELDKLKNQNSYMV